MLGPEKGSLQRLQLIATLEEIGRLAVAERVDAVVIAGDLFDSNSPSSRSVDAVKRVVGGLTAERIRLFVVPGTHDSYEASSIWRALDFDSDLVTVFTDETGSVVVPDLDLTVYGLVFPHKKAPAGALKKLRRSGHTALHVGIVHGALRIPDIVEDESLIFTEEEAAATGMSYLALGHWHSFIQRRFGNVVACYPGAPEFVSSRQKEAGRVVLVTIDASGAVDVEPRTVGARRFEQLSIPMDTTPSEEAVRSMIAAKADRDLVLEVTLDGLASLEMEIDPERLVAELAPDFFHLRIEDKSRPPLDDVVLEQYPEATVTGTFARIMKSRSDEAADPAARAVCEEALRLGVALLEGKDVLG